MNLIEAIKSGKPFKRSLWNRDYVRPPFANLNLPAEDLIAEDWEVEPAVPITRKQFFEAYAHAVAELPSNPTNSSVLEMMADRLGL